MNAIVIFKEKYGKRYFDASTPEALGLACVKVLKERAEAGYFYYREYEADGPKFDKETQEALALNDEQLAVIPETLRAELQRKRDRAKRSVTIYEQRKQQENEWFDNLQKIIDLPAKEAAALTYVNQRNGRTYNLAYDLLNVRSDYQYEEFEVLDLESTEE